MARYLRFAFVLIMAACIGCNKKSENGEGDDKLPAGMDAPKLEPIATMKAATNSALVAFAFSPDGETFASGARVVAALPSSDPSEGDDHTLFLWDASTGAKKTHLAGYSKTSLCVCFSEDGEQLIVGNLSGCVKLDVSTGETIATILRVPLERDPDGLGEDRGVALSPASGLVALSHHNKIEIKKFRGSARSRD